LFNDGQSELARHARTIENAPREDTLADSA
jgi:hypothetical protein